MVNRLEEGLQVDPSQGGHHLFISMYSVDVHVVAKGSRKENRIMGDDGERSAEETLVKRRNVDAVDQNLTLDGVEDSKEGQCEGGFSAKFKLSAN